MRKSGYVLRRFGIAILLIAICALPSVAQTGECRDEWPDHLVRFVKVKARWLPPLNLPLKFKDKLTPDKLRELRLAVIGAINSERNKSNGEFAGLGKLPLVDVNFVRACGRSVAAPTCEAAGLGDKCVDVEVRAYAISTDPVFMGSVLLPLPRSNKFSFLSNVPKPLRFLNPKFGVTRDRESGTTPSLEVSSDLLSHFGKKGDDHTPEDSSTTAERTSAPKASLYLNALGSRSIEHDFYTSRATLSFVLRQPTEQVESAGFDVSFSANRQPQLLTSYLDNSLRLRGQVSLNPALGLLNRVILSAGYRRSSNRRVGGSAVLSDRTSENSFEARGILEGRVLNGFTRLGVWFDGGKPKNRPHSYHRVAALWGYEKEIPVGEQTIGLEVLAGAGRTSSHAPDYALYYGGNSLSSFIYDDVNDQSFAGLPNGPVLRSLGNNQAGFSNGSGPQRGATSYQHLNLTISLPLGNLSYPLIPAEVVNDNPRKTLRDLINFAVNTGEEAFSLNLQDEGLSEEEADKKAAKVFNEIRPGIKFLSNYAKLYAVKPMIMFDATRLSRFDQPQAQVRYGIGGGLQLTVVVAKFEVGYMHAVNRSQGDPRGNFIGRLVFQNLF
jgi:hypothetical protein